MSNQDFDLVVPITRAYKKDGKMFIGGVASSTDIDSHETIFNESAQKGFEFDINSASGTDDPVVIEAEHLGNEEPMNHLGAIVSAFVDKDNKLNIEAQLDELNPKAVYYYNVLTDPDPKKGRPKKLGLSINGAVQDAHYEFRQEINKRIRVFDRVILKKVGIVRAPSNPSTWVEKIARSVDWSDIKELVMEDNKEVVRDEVSTETQEAVETVTTETEVVTEEVTEETAAEVVTETPVTEVTTVETQEVVEETRQEEAPEAQTEEEIERTNSWSVCSLTEAIEGISKAMGYLEYYVSDAKWGENKDTEISVARDALDKLNTAVPNVLALIMREIAPVQEAEAERMDTSNGPGVHQDLSDEVEQRSELQVSIDTDSIKESVTTALVEKFGSLLDEMRSEMKKEFDSLLEETQKTANEKVEELARQVETLSKDKTELVERLSKVESLPATVPGFQNVGQELVSRTMNQDEIARAKRAKAKEIAIRNKDSRTLTKLVLDTNWVPEIEL